MFWIIRDNLVTDECLEHANKKGNQEACSYGRDEFNYQYYGAEVDDSWFDG